MANISSDRSLRTLVHLCPPPPRPDAAGGLQHPVGDGGAEAGEAGGAAAAAPAVGQRGPRQGRRRHHGEEHGQLQGLGKGDCDFFR